MSIENTRAHLINGHLPHFRAFFGICEMACRVFAFGAFLSLMLAHSAKADDRFPAPAEKISPTNEGVRIANQLKAKQNNFMISQGFADWIIQSTNDFISDREGQTVAITLNSPNVNAKGLELVSRVVTLTNLIITCHSRDDTLTPEGVSFLSRLPLLTSLKLRCFGRLPDGVFSEICRLRTLRELNIVSSTTSEQEFGNITNLTRLSTLRISYWPLRGEQPLSVLTNLVALNELELRWDSITNANAIPLRELRASLTNCQIHFVPPLRDNDNFGDGVK